MIIGNGPLSMVGDIVTATWTIDMQEI